jgi:hypothetical protein
MKERDPRERSKKPTDRVRAMLEANRSLVTGEEYQASLATLTAVELAQEEINKENDKAEFKGEGLA